jgi:predicted nucleotidyltransferase
VAGIDSSVAEKARAALEVLSRMTEVDSAYVFGSQVEGRADEWSDVDLAVFVHGLENWSLQDRVGAAVEVQKKVGDDVELHFFPVSAAREPDPASFADWILAHGIELSKI